MNPGNTFDKPRCHCAVFGIFNHPEAAVMTYYGLHAQQHRGQEASGIVSSRKDLAQNRTLFGVHKDYGLVMDVFKEESTLKVTLQGTAAIGHNRYSTTGAAENRYNIQPFLVNYKHGHISLAHNGNLTNYRSLRTFLQNEGTIFQSTSDSEVFLHLIARSKKRTRIERVIDACKTVEGAFSLVMLTDDSLIAIRDPHGFRPLAIGKLNGAYVVASETCAFDIIGAEYIRDVEPGEIIEIDDVAAASGELKSYQFASSEKRHHCIFEYVYFSRPDSRIFGESVDKVRRKLGKQLATESPVVPADDERLIVISVPDTSNTATLGYVSASNKSAIPAKMEIGLIRSHYVGRTFIAPEQKNRELKVKAKFNTVKGVLKGKKVVLIDDSIVRGTTAKQLIKLVREAEPKEIHFRVTSPPITHPCYFGMDFPSKGELIANQMENDVEKIREELGVDSLTYLSLEKMLAAVPHDKKRSYCTACFTGKYPLHIENHSKNENEL